MGDDDADRSRADDQRDVEAGARFDRTGRVLVNLGIVRECIDAFGAPALEHAAALRAGPLETQTEDLVGAGTVGRFDAQRPLGGGQRDRHHPRSDQAAQAPADELQEARQLDLACKRRADFVQRLELRRPVRRILEAAVHFRSPPPLERPASRPAP